jgi:hypothetical protein
MRLEKGDPLRYSSGCRLVGFVVELPIVGEFSFGAARDADARGSGGTYPRKAWWKSQREFSMWLTKIAKTQRKENVCAVVCLGVRTSLRRPFGRYGKELATERPRKLNRGR